jgi:hypothetical protein
MIVNCFSKCFFDGRTIEAVFSNEGLINFDNNRIGFYRLHMPFCCLSGSLFGFFLPSSDKKIRGQNLNRSQCNRKDYGDERLRACLSECRN